MRRVITGVADASVVVREAGRLLWRHWPVLLVIAIVLAALITIVPIVLALFVGLLLLKFLAIAIFGREPRRIKHYTGE